MKTRLIIAVIIYGVIQAVVFGAMTILVLSFPSIKESWTWLMPSVTIVSFLVAIPIAWMIAPRMQARYWRRGEHYQA
ncbi:hypothetical protein [Consotaella salsifontis]|uniref:Uncharacterized protein n=1 Tax=Consotaella salsifontis TaxID=1365950 RepID=A0A1T4REV6_9HYPH|nr:hypothetical protein [Consotaella salsifontis]SKA14201.1 hypothetical protein SAMN05428963_106240 [Consotaella salsifontis]